MKKILCLLSILLCLSGCTTYAVKVEEPLGDVLTVSFIDVGQGDSIFIELPDKTNMLIDAGEAKSSNKIIDYIDNLGYDSLDYVIGTHPHSDHIGGLSRVIDSFNIGSIYMPKVVATSKTYENLLETIKNKSLSIKKGFAGVVVEETDNLKIEMLAPNSEEYSSYNNYSIVLKITYGDTSFLFMGDAETLSEKEIKGNLKADVLKVGHHGSNTSSSSSFLEKVKPKYAVISVGEDNKYKHPSDEVLTRLNKYTNIIYRTDLNGTIKMISDGINIKIECEK